MSKLEDDLDASVKLAASLFGLSADAINDAKAVVRERVAGAGTPPPEKRGPGEISLIECAVCRGYHVPGGCPSPNPSPIPPSEPMPSIPKPERSGPKFFCAYRGGKFYAAFVTADAAFAAAGNDGDVRVHFASELVGLMR